MKKLNILVVFPILCTLLFLFNPISVLAEEAGNGGGIQTTGEIGFYEETKATTEPTELPASGTERPTEKPKGKFPSTGELVKKSLSISGVALVIIAAIIFFWKRKKADGKQEEGS
ncbi:LPXTG cell wall anchor domain-containing protein [Enterococcus sp. 5H]|uniref:LPXTG cell wall anchor domain-containing protein n=1 Tax=Enterococcus sp. 5H TaxID=1229490 RepID=UPI002302396A|nr:LPXTG cell wall anchor domain-containing protein [Enterococcus sp. 5H]MDA9470605.1 hypothetical protein [Enterococcus sp. 5H]